MPKPTPRTLVSRAKTASTAAAKHALALIALVERRKQRITEDFYDIGEALRDLARPEYYRAIGHASFAELLAARALMGPTQAYKLVQIARSFTREQALALGLEKAFAIVTYAAATPAHEVPGFLLDTGKIHGAPIATLTAREISRAAQRVRARAHAAHATPLEKRAAREARAWQAELRKRGAAGAVVTVRDEHGELWLEARVPASQWK